MRMSNTWTQSSIPSYTHPSIAHPLYVACTFHPQPRTTIPSPSSTNTQALAHILRQIQGK